MPNYCVPSGTMSSATDSPQGTGTTQESKFNADDVLRAAEEFLRPSMQAQARKTEDIDELTRILNGHNYTGVQTDAQTLRQTHSAAARLVRELQAAALVGRAAAYDNIRNIIDAVSGTTIGRMTWFMNLKNKFYGAFVNDRSEMHKWFSVFADMPGLEPYRNLFMRSFESINPTARAANTLFGDRIEKYIRDITPLANRLGLSNEEVALLVGDWLIARGMPERNDLLIRRWTDEVAQEMQKPEAKRNLAFIKERVNRIRQLQKFLDSPMNAYDAKRDGKVWSGGMTNGQARARMSEIMLSTGLSEAELDQWAKRMSAEFHFINMERARRGTLDPKVAAKFPDFEWYAPAMHANSESGVSNTVGATNDATPYNPGSYFAIEGATSRPDSAFKSWIAMANKAALEIGGLEFGNALYALDGHLRAMGIDPSVHGLHSVDYSSMMSNVHSRDPRIHAAYNAMYNQGGFVANIFTRDPSGDVRMTKRFYYFKGTEFEYNGAHFSVGMLNKALSSDFHLAEAGPIINGLGKATSFMGQLTTRSTPLFSPVSGMRDFHERALNMVNRVYLREDGTALNGSSVSVPFLTNAFKAGRILFQGMMGKLDANSHAGQLWQEYTDNGLFQRFSQNFAVSESNADATLARLRGLETAGQRAIAPDAEALERGIISAQNRIGLNMNKPGMKRLRNNMGNRWRQFIGILDGWNDYFQNVASFSHYMTLREMGVGRIEARSGVLQEMNMNQRGRLGPWLQALAPFVVPTVQSGTALLRTLGMGARDVRDIPKAGMKGYAAMAAAFAAYSILMGLARESMGTDENGNSVFDAMSISELSTSLPIGLGGGQDEYFKFPVGYGPAQVGATLALGWERINQGRMTTSDLAFDTAFTLLKNTSPGSWPNYDFHENPMSWLMSLLTPMPFRPLSEVATNTNYFGDDIWKEPGNEYTSRAEAGRTSTPRRFHNFALAMREAGLDLQPEIYEHIERGLALGPIRAFSVYANQIDDIYKGSLRPSALDSVDPFLAALGITSWYGKAPNAAQSLFHEARRKFTERIRMDGIDLAKPEGMSNDRLEDYKRSVLQDHGWSINDINDYIRIWRGETALQQQGRDFNARNREAWLRMDTSDELRAEFDQLYYDNQEVYQNVVDNLNYYR